MMTKNYTLTEKLQTLAVTIQVPHCTLSDLFTVLRQFHPDLPKDPRTLLQTKLTYNVSEICGGHYYNFGLVSGLQEKIKYSVEFLPDNFRNLRIGQAVIQTAKPLPCIIRPGKLMMKLS